MNVPKLRFGEFEGEWQETTIGSIAEVTTGNKDTQNRVDDGTYPFFVRSQTVERINSFAYDGEAILTSGDGVGVGKNFHYINGKFDFHQRVYCIYKFRLKIYGKFVYSYFSEKFNQRVMQLSAKNSVDSVRRTMVTEMPINLPYYEEQQKIADFLSAVDEKITALTAQKTALTHYKQGMMQRIFAQTLRFKDDNGADYPEWDSMRLEELGEFKSGVGFSESEQGGQEGIPFFKVSDMNLSENTFHMNIANHYVTEEQIQKLKLKVIKKDAIIFAKVGAAIFLERKRIAKNFLIDNNMMAFIPKANLLFMKYLFETVQLSKFAQVGALPSYNSSDLGIIKVGLPNSYEEQTKIARFLTECDDKINAVDAQIQSAQQWKQGLLQQMFV